ncbi:hypothetical protein L1049_008398 [Liquidambar formosana]|uniref:Uncharacterized protein n=1 Tax=Liquidambar formosana TaxID=63359 RepID=A0AAP0X4J6_LIQFO
MHKWPIYNWANFSYACFGSFFSFLLILSMDICSHCGESVSDDVSSFESSVSLKQCTCAAIGDGSVNDLGYTLGESLHIQDAEESVNTSNVDDDNELDEGIIGGELIIDETQSTQKRLGKSVTFPCSGNMLSSDASSTDEEDETSDTLLQRNCNHSLPLEPEPMRSAFSRSMSLPAPPVKLVSAMKGGREKEQGTSAVKLTVKWAPDVYDPPPTILLPAAKSKNQQRSKANKKNEVIYKKNGKNKQKGNGKALRGSSGKDKKQFRRLHGSSDRCYKSIDASDRLVDYDDPSEDFDVGSPDSYCGSSFLRKSFPKVHMSVAEAL